MSSCETLNLATKFVEGDCCYFGIFDLGSSSNRPEKWDEAFRTAKQMARRQEWKALFHLNQGWIDLAGEGELLSWITLFDGVFKVELRILGEQSKFEFGAEAKGDFLGERKENLLNCPSGNIAVDSLSRLGSTSMTPLIITKPGTYRVAFVRNVDEESKHEFLEDRSQYPTNDGPDWLIYMQSLEG